MSHPSKRRRHASSAFANALSDALGGVSAAVPARTSASTQKQADVNEPLEGKSKPESGTAKTAKVARPEVLAKLGRKHDRQVAREKAAGAPLNQGKRTSLLGKAHVIPESTSSQVERRLNKLATRGVVKLFNAVQRQKKLSREHSRNTDKKKRKTPTDSFNDILANAPAPVLKKDDDDESSQGSLTAGYGDAMDGVAAPPDVQWDVLGEDYMLGKTTGAFEDGDESGEDDDAGDHGGSDGESE